MRLKDFFCALCGTIKEDVIVDSCETTETRLYCQTCQGGTVHYARCNGGIRVRCRINDWPTDPEFYRGQVKALDASASIKNEDGTEEPVRRYNGTTKKLETPLDAAPRYHNGTDVRETRRDKLKHATRRKRGTLPLVFDGARK